MTQDQKIIRAKVGLLELAKQLGNVSQACKMMGYSRDSFYRFKGGAGGNQGRPHRRRSGGGIRGPPEPDLQLEEAAGGRCGERLRGWQFGERSHQRSPGRSSVPADRPVEGRKRFFGTKARQLSRAARRAMVERTNPVLPISRQCRFLVLPRSSVSESRARPARRILRSWR